MSICGTISKQMNACFIRSFSLFLGHGQILLVPSGRDLVPAVGDAEALPPLPALPPAAAGILTGVSHIYSLGRQLVPLVL